MQISPIKKISAFIKASLSNLDAIKGSSSGAADFFRFSSWWFNPTYNCTWESIEASGRFTVAGVGITTLVPSDKLSLDVFDPTVESMLSVVNRLTISTTYLSTNWTSSSSIVAWVWGVFVIWSSFYFPFFGCFTQPVFPVFFRDRCLVSFRAPYLIVTSEHIWNLCLRSKAAMIGVIRGYGSHIMANRSSVSAADSLHSPIAVWNLGGNIAILPNAVDWVKMSEAIVLQRFVVKFTIFCYSSIYDERWLGDSSFLAFPFGYHERLQKWCMFRVEVLQSAVVQFRVLFAAGNLYHVLKKS